MLEEFSFNEPTKKELTHDLIKDEILDMILDNDQVVRDLSKSRDFTIVVQGNTEEVKFSKLEDRYFCEIPSSAVDILTEELKKVPEGNKGGGKEETITKPAIPEEYMEYLKYAKELKEKETLATKKKSIVELASKNFTSAEQKAGFEKFIDTQNIDTTKESSELSEKFAGIYGSIFKETIGENKVYQSGGDGAGKFDDVWAKQAERIKNNKK